MTETQSERAKARFERDSTELCAVCQGTGRVLSKSAVAKAKRGGNASYQVSLMKGQLSMSERGKLGGRPRELALADLDAVDRGEEPVSCWEKAPESTDSRPDPRHLGK